MYREAGYLPTECREAYIQGGIHLSHTPGRLSWWVYTPLTPREATLVGINPSSHPGRLPWWVLTLLSHPWEATLVGINPFTPLGGYPGGYYSPFHTPGGYHGGYYTPYTPLGGYPGGYYPYTPWEATLVGISLYTPLGGYPGGIPLYAPPGRLPWWYILHMHSWEATLVVYITPIHPWEATLVVYALYTPGYTPLYHTLRYTPLFHTLRYTPPLGSPTLDYTSLRLSHPGLYLSGPLVPQCVSLRTVSTSVCTSEGVPTVVYLRGVLRWYTSGLTSRVGYTSELTSRVGLYSGC